MELETTSQENGQASSSSTDTTASSGDVQQATGTEISTQADANAATSSVASTPVYNPNFKFKVLDSEHEIDPLFRPLIKDQDTEAKVKDVFTKAYAMEVMKQDREKARKDFEQFKTQIDPHIKTLNSLNDIIQKKDWDTFFKRIGVPDEEIFGFVSKKLDLLNATPEQRAEYERQIALRDQHYQQTQQLEALQQAYAQTAVQARTMQLESVLTRPDVSKYAVAWDERAGSIGAFRELVKEEAAAHYYRTGQDLSAEEAVNLVVQKFGKVIPIDQPGTTATQATSGGQTTMTAPPVIPAVQGRGTSPIKKVPKSLDDLKKLARSMA